MTTKEMIAVMQANEDGKTIEYHYHRTSELWVETNKSQWNWGVKLNIV